MRLAATLATAFLLEAACATPPRPAAETVRLAGSRPAIVEGMVRDRGGRPVRGVGVQALPRGRDVPWSPAAVTDAEGRFRLSVAAPADYGFLLSSGGVSVVTSDPSDPARKRISVQPGDRKSDLDLTYLRDEWRALTKSTALPQP